MPTSRGILVVGACPSQQEVSTTTSRRNAREMKYSATQIALVSLSRRRVLALQASVSAHVDASVSLTAPLTVRMSARRMAMKSQYGVSWVSDSANGNASVSLLALLGAGNECEASADETNRQRLRLLARALDAGNECEANGGDLVVPTGR